MAIPTPNTVQTAKHHKSPLGAHNRAPTQAIPSQQLKHLSADQPRSQAGLCANVSRKPALFTTTYHPQTNGQVESFNRTLAAMLRCYVEDNPGLWCLPMAFSGMYSALCSCGLWEDGVICRRHGIV